MNDIRDAHYTLGKASLNAGEYAQAITHLNSAIELDADFVEAHHALALAYFGQHKVEEAKAAARQALEIDKTYQPLLTFLQAIMPQHLITDISDKELDTQHPLTSSNKEETPDKTSEENINTDKEMERGCVFLSNKQYPQAEAAFKKVIAAEPNSTVAHYNLAQTYLEIGALDDAQTEVDIVLRISPQYQPATQLKSAITFLKKRQNQKKLQRKIIRFGLPLALLAIAGFIVFRYGVFSSWLPERIPPKVAIDATLEDPTNKNGYIDAGENVRLKLTLTNSGSTAKNLNVRVVPKTITGLRFQTSDRMTTLRKNEFKIIRIPITADKQVLSKKVTLKIDVLDKQKTILATTNYQLSTKSK